MFRFTIRELVLLTVIAAMGVGWWLREQQLQDKVDRLQEKVVWLETAIDREGFVFAVDQLGPRLFSTRKNGEE